MKRALFSAIALCLVAGCMDGADPKPAAQPRASDVPTGKITKTTVALIYSS